MQKLKGLRNSQGWFDAVRFKTYGNTVLTMYLSYFVLYRGLQQSLARLLSDIQQFQPNGVLKPGGVLDKAISFEGLDKLLRSEVKTM